MDNQRGIGLPELLISLLLASFMTLSLMRHYLSTKQQYHHIQAALEQSVDLQLVTDLLRNSTRRAGFTPCLHIEHLVTLDQRELHKRLVAIELGLDDAPSLQISRMSEHFDTVLQTVSPTHLLTTSRQTIKRDQSILIADCYHAEVQKVAQVKHTIAGQIITLTHSLAFSYHAPIYIGEWLEETYFVQSHGKGSLFYHLKHAEELTTAVHTLSVQVNRHKGRTLLQIILGLDNAHTLELDTMVRAH